VRNHGDTPAVDAEGFRLRVDGLVRSPLELSLGTLRERFTPVTLTATLQCAGNRRTELIALEPIPGELPWGAEAIGNATWTGARLSDVLRSAGIADDAAHVAFLGLDTIEKQGRRFGFGGSIPIEKAVRSEVLLAWEMNGQPLTAVHGAPLRLVVPGYVGARSVKWLAHITAQAEPSDNYYQAHAYKLFPPHVRASSVDWSQGIMLGESTLGAVITKPENGATVAGDAEVEGWAIAGGDHRLDRVELTTDDGESWHTATLLDPERPWVWSRWRARLTLPAKSATIAVRAWDDAGHTQPPDATGTWNFKGYMNNCWHRVTVRR
jgi:sulfite oxidase